MTGKEWPTEGAVQQEILIADEVATWIRSRPPVIQTLMRRFPPGCVVKGKRPLRCPAPGQLAKVYSYLQNDDGTTSIKVVSIPEDGIGYCCSPEWLEVVSYNEDITPEWIDTVLNDQG